MWMRYVITNMLVAALLVATNVAPAQQNVTPSVSKSDFARAIAAPDDDVEFKAFLTKLPQVTRGDNPVRTYYVFEGDLFLTEEQLRSTLRSYANAPSSLLPIVELKVMSVGGKSIFWPMDQRSLTYVVDRASFLSQSAYESVVANMRAAANAWSSVCPECKLTYTHKQELDTTAGSPAATFVVRYEPNETAFIAAAFFPNDPPDRRVVVITPSYFTTTVDPVGVLRHEIGHINGYRHEHIGGVPGCYYEDQNWKPLTAYDAHSVMHYFCGGGGSLELALTDVDKLGHRKLYAP